MIFEGAVHKFGRDVDTDVIIPARYLNTNDPAELGSHCMEDIDAEFVGRVRPGDIVVAGENFGCGSSRTWCACAAGSPRTSSRRRPRRSFVRRSRSICSTRRSGASSSPASLT
jgi:hypothetical protein